MKAHELAKYLLTLPDLPVVMNGWGSDEGVDVYVIGANVQERNDRDGNVISEIYLEQEDIKW